MENILTFVENLFFDEKLYWQASGLSETKRFEVVYQRFETPRGWRIRAIGDDDWLCFSIKNATETFTNLNVDMADVERQIGSSIMMQAVFANLVLSSAAKLFGKEHVDTCIERAGQFSQELDKMVGAQTKEKRGSSPKLRIVNDRHP